jgi:NADH-quinone oxidoreductase subunit L
MLDGRIANFVADWGFQLDPLSAVMILVVTGVGFLIHVYATGYMAHEGGYYRFFGYLNLFMFAMLMLVLANNFLLLFVAGKAGTCRLLLLHRILLPQKIRIRRRQESIHRQPHR